MNLPEPLIHGELISRYKRFLADIRLESGEIVTAHCANSGRMTGLAEPGSVVILSESANPKRKLRFTWQLVKIENNWVGVNTLLPNRLAREALENKLIPELSTYHEIKAEVRWGLNTRFDFLLQNENERCYLEVKSVTLAEAGTAMFPDAVTARGTKHLRELMHVVASGSQAAMLFVVNRSDCRHFIPAEKIDPVYAQTLREAADKGVKIWVYATRIEPPVIEMETLHPLQYFIN